jgi:hypothetical protein
MGRDPNPKLSTIEHSRGSTSTALSSTRRVGGDGAAIPQRPPPPGAHTWPVRSFHLPATPTPYTSPSTAFTFIATPSRTATSSAEDASPDTGMVLLEEYLAAFPAGSEYRRMGPDWEDLAKRVNARTTAD